MLELADAVVVGGGIVGLAVTAELSRRFSRVLLVEADRCGGRATAAGFGWVNASSKWQDLAYHRLNAEACRHHVALAAEWDAGRTGWNGGGSLMWASQSDQTARARLDERFDTLQSWEYPVVRASRGEMQALEPNVRFEEDAIGLFAPSEGWVSSPRLVRHFTEQARERHAEISEFTRATGFTTDHRGAIATVETTRGRVSTRVLVLCAGVDTGELAHLATGASNTPRHNPVRRSPGLLVETAPLPPLARVFRVCYPTDANGLHLRPSAENGILIGADDTDAICQENESPSGTSPGPSQSQLSAAAASLIDRAAAILPDMDRDTAFTPRICVRPIPNDGYPIAGELPGVSGAYLLVTHSGITLGPLLGQLLADEIITGRKSPWLSPYRADRFRRAAGL
jgi:glycine/D-amino acid oxidase-like deaminating enzyme